MKTPEQPSQVLLDALDALARERQALVEEIRRLRDEDGGTPPTRDDDD